MSYKRYYNTKMKKKEAFFMNSKAKILFHIDLNAFFAQAALIENPALKGKVFAVGNHKFNRGVVLTASYEARKYGIKSGMPTHEALKRYPGLVLTPPNFPIYEKHSKRFIDFLCQYTELVEQASIDEAYVDVTDLQDEIHPLKLAEEIQTTLLQDYNLPCSIGIGPTLFLAKMASDMKKPLGITVLRIRELETTLYPLPIESMYGIGKKTAPKLKELNIHTMGDFVRFTDEAVLIQVLGEKGYHQAKAALLGKSSNEVDPYRYAIPQSIGNSKTYGRDLIVIEQLYDELSRLTLQVSERLKEHQMQGKTISIQIRYHDFSQITRGKTLHEVTDDPYTIFHVAQDLLDTHWDLSPVRLLGVSVSNLIENKELEKSYDLFTLDASVDKEEEVLKLMHQLKDTYGENIIQKGIKTKKSP